MNRTQCEAAGLIPKRIICKNCELRTEQRRALNLKRHKARKAQAAAMYAGVKSGAVTVLFYQDELTGWHINDKTGKMSACPER